MGFVVLEQMHPLRPPLFVLVVDSRNALVAPATCPSLNFTQREVAQILVVRNASEKSEEHGTTKVKLFQKRYP
jgi:hypothetical protein